MYANTARVSDLSPLAGKSLLREIVAIGAPVSDLSPLKGISLSNPSIGGASVKSVGNAAFMDCSSLTNVILSANLSEIGGAAFADCTSLTGMTIPAKVANIGNGAFRSCPNLTNVCAKGSAPRLGLDVFLHDTRLTVYYLPGTKGWGKTFGGRPTAVWEAGRTGAGTVGVQAR